jgi:hypothetical protein
MLDCTLQLFYMTVRAAGTAAVIRSVANSIVPQ